MAWGLHGMQNESQNESGLANCKRKRTKREREENKTRKRTKREHYIGFEISLRRIPKRIFPQEENKIPIR